MNETTNTALNTGTLTTDAAATGAGVVPANSPVSAVPSQVAVPTGEPIDIAQFAAVKMRVAQIKSVEKVEKSNKLYKIQVDMGPLGERQIVSGIAKFYTPEQLIGRKIIVIANLKPAMLMGVESHGMLLAASSADKTQLSIIAPAEDIAIGATVS